MKEKRGKGKSYWSGFFRAMIVALLVLTQFVAIFALSFWLAGYTVYIYLLIEMASILIIRMSTTRACQIMRNTTVHCLTLLMRQRQTIWTTSSLFTLTLLPKATP